MSAWRRWLKNGGTEKDVRDYLHRNGFRGPSARFDYLELRAIQRPGWLQVFEFRVHVQDESGQAHHLLGLARDDERRGIEVFLSESEEERAEVWKNWSAGLITLERTRSPWTPWLLGIFGLVVLLALAGAVLSP